MPPSIHDATSLSSSSSDSPAPGLDEAKARRAIDLSIEKYCSVIHSLKSDIPITYQLELDLTACAGPACSPRSRWLLHACPLQSQIRHEWGGQVHRHDRTTRIPRRGTRSGAGDPGTRDRMVLHAALGAAEHQAALRVEAAWHLLLNPERKKG